MLKLSLCKYRASRYVGFTVGCGACPGLGRTGKEEGGGGGGTMCVCWGGGAG